MIRTHWDWMVEFHLLSVRWLSENVTFSYSFLRVNQKWTLSLRILLMICLNISVAQIGITWKVSSIKDCLNYIRWCGETHTEFGWHLLVAAQEKMGTTEGRLFTSFSLVFILSLNYFILLLLLLLLIVMMMVVVMIMLVLMMIPLLISEPTFLDIDHWLSNNESPGTLPFRFWQKIWITEAPNPTEQAITRCSAFSS